MAVPAVASQASLTDYVVAGNASTNLDFMVIIFSFAVATIFYVVFLYASEEPTVRPTVNLQGERKRFLPLILPDECVKVVEKTTDASRHGSSWKWSWDWHRGTSRTPWDELELNYAGQDLPGNSGRRPLLVFVNSRSGGGQGAELLRNFGALLHNTQVVDLKEDSPQAALRWWSRTGLRYRVLVCGGDGTVGWVLGCLEELTPEYVPHVAILPLGTGNDLARVLGWGSGFGGGSVCPVLQKVSEAHAANLDRWEVACRDVLPRGRPDTLPNHPRKTMMMCNYFGIGVDAAVALDFHQMRERSPHLFFSRLVNKVWYMKSGALNLWRRSCQDLARTLTLECDGALVEVPPNVEGIVVLNIPSFGGGCDLWGWARDEDSDDSDLDSDCSLLRSSRPSMQDKKLEVVGVHGSFQLGAAQVGLYHACRLAQASRVKITSKASIPVQVDGEPWLFARNGEIDITWKGQALMLARQVAASHAVATDVIDWGLEQNVINIEQRNQLMREIARRAHKRSLSHGLGSGGSFSRSFGA